jgi:phosphoribosylaminoimidazole-succinocarboxamide synthase
MKTFPDKVELKLDQPLYTGSVQKLHDVPGHPELIISETTAGGSVFDVGTIFNIEGSDTGRAAFRHMVFQELQNADAWKELAGELTDESPVMKFDTSGLLKGLLAEYCEKGAPTHHAGMVDRESGEVFAKGYPSKLSNLTLIKKYQVIKPKLKRVLGWHFYDYAKYHTIDGNVVPLEFIVRLGVTNGASILRKYNRLGDAEKAAYLNDLGVDSLSAWSRFDPPIVDLTTKYEPEDRNISRQEAALISSLDGEMFGKSMIMAVLGAYMLQRIFSKMGLSLWDMKWEIARDDKELVFVDTIDTDSVRVTYNMEMDNKSYFVHFNKQAMRDYYKIIHSDWLDAVNASKKEAAKSGNPFTEILAEGQKSGKYPKNPEINVSFLELQKRKFVMVQDFIQGKGGDILEEAQKIAFGEIEYYTEAGKLAEYEALNAV